MSQQECRLSGFDPARRHHSIVRQALGDVVVANVLEVSALDDASTEVFGSVRRD